MTQVEELIGKLRFQSKYGIASTRDLMAEAADALAEGEAERASQQDRVARLEDALTEIAEWKISSRRRDAPYLATYWEGAFLFAQDAARAALQTKTTEEISGGE